MKMKQTIRLSARASAMSKHWRTGERPSRLLLPLVLLAACPSVLLQNRMCEARAASLFSVTRANWRPAESRRPRMSLQLTTTAFPASGTIPKKFTCDGPDVSPALSWTDAPTGTKTFALIVDDPDAPAGTWVHWVLYNLPAGTHKLPEGVGKDSELPDGSRQGRNDFGKIGYNGPCPPRGSVHRYFFKLYALDSKLELKAGSTKADLERTMQNHVLAHSELIGKFSH
jgi:Raf kinase inhibitor-like YbhB/YbcL family protein